MLECPHSRVRAAAAVALLRLGWGVGLGALSFAALHVLEHMVGVPLRGGVMPTLPDGASEVRLDGTGRYTQRGGEGGEGGEGGGGGDATSQRLQLTKQVAEATAQWEAYLAAGQPGRAAAACLLLTRLRISLASLTNDLDPRSAAAPAPAALAAPAVPAAPAAAAAPAALAALAAPAAFAAPALGTGLMPLLPGMRGYQRPALSPRAAPPLLSPTGTAASAQAHAAAAGAQAHAAAAGAQSVAPSAGPVDNAGGATRMARCAEPYMKGPTLTLPLPSA